MIDANESRDIEKEDKVFRVLAAFMLTSMWNRNSSAFAFTYLLNNKIKYFGLNISTSQD